MSIDSTSTPALEEDSLSYLPRPLLLLAVLLWLTLCSTQHDYVTDISQCINMLELLTAEKETIFLKCYHFEITDHTICNQRERGGITFLQCTARPSNMSTIWQLSLPYKYCHFFW
jgi:hypothetical protein